MEGSGKMADVGSSTGDSIEGEVEVSKLIAEFELRALVVSSGNVDDASRGDLLCWEIDTSPSDPDLGGGPRTVSG